MVQREEINGMIFIAQTTFYVYQSEEDLQNSKPTLVCSDQERFDANKRLARKKEANGDKENKFIVF